jgi:hypothetical protein
VLLAAGFFALPYLFNISTRFLIPCLPFVSLALAMVLVPNRTLAIVVVLFHAVSSFPPVARAYAAQYSWIIDRFPLKAALRLETEEAYLARAFSPYAIARMIERAVPPDESVFTFQDVAYAYTSRDIRVAYQSASNHVLGDILWTPLVPRFQPRTLVTFRFPQVAVRAIRIEQLAQDEKKEWSVAEVRIPSLTNVNWRIDARPNPWEAELAVDGSSVTRWRALEPAKPGMIIEVDFGHEAALSHLELECADVTENTHRLKLLGSDSSGIWKDLSAAPQIDAISIGTNLRMEATRQMRRRGAGFMLVFPNDLFAADYSENRERWGLTPAGEAAGARLFRLAATDP